MSVGFYLDQSRCTGCRACQVVCKDKNRLEVGTLYREAHSYTVGEFPKVQGFSYTFSCNHCEDPVCLKNCPTGAIYKAADGTVIQDQSKCIGCLHVCDELARMASRSISRKRVFPVSATAAMACVKRAPSLLAWLAARTRALDFGDMDELRAKYGSDLDNGSIVMLPSPEETHPNVIVKAKALRV